MSFIIMQLSLTYYSLDVIISFRTIQFENVTLIQVRCCHLLGIWWGFLVGFWFWMIRYMLIFVNIRYKICFFVRNWFIQQIAVATFRAQLSFTKQQAGTKSGHNQNHAQFVHAIALTVHNKSCMLVVCFDSYKFLL